ncbi:MAG: hypothetical protein F6K30_22775 [Cyanothece sp. SIO2G6]|nr:hypothetical protein [Cyanothece sp. SIO2G6]
MIKLAIQTNDSDLQSCKALIQGAVDQEIHRLRLSLERTDQALNQLEKKYQISSQTFRENGVAEDLEGGDEEYITWMGEIKIKEQLLTNLRQLEQIEYVTN